MIPEPHFNPKINQPFTNRINPINLKYMYISNINKLKLKLAFLHVFSYFWRKRLKGLRSVPS